MATRIDMPQLGLTMEKGAILQGLKAEGETVQKGQPVVLIQTEKVEYEVEAPAGGVLLRHVAKEGAEMPVGAMMGVLGEPGEDISPLLVGTALPAAPKGEVAAPSAAAPAAAPAEAGSPPVRAPGERVKISPVAKKLAQEHGIDIAALTGTGPEGRIVREDVEKAIAARGAPDPTLRAGYPQRRAPSEAAAAVPDAIPLSGIPSALASTAPIALRSTNSR